MSSKMTEDCLNRQAIIYIRQSSPTQVTENLESQRRQYALVEKAKEYGFSRIEVIDDDLGRSGSGVVDRPGFTRMLALVCKGDVGAIFCIEASRLARNGRDWHPGRDPPHDGQFDGLCGLNRESGRGGRRAWAIAVDNTRRKATCWAAKALGESHNLDCAGAVRETADKSALFQGGDQAVDPGFRA